MDWRNIVRPIIIIAIAVCVVVVGVHKIKDTYTGFMREYEGTEGGEVGENIEITIPEDTTVKEAAGMLKEAGLIKYKLAFQLRMTGSQYSGSLQPGTYTLNSSMSTLDMIKTLCYVESTREVLYTITVPEGFTVEQIADRCEEKGFVLRMSSLLSADQETLNTHLKYHRQKLNTLFRDFCFLLHTIYTRI